MQQWLDEGRRFTLLDTRNHYEIASGSFNGATHLAIDHFRDFTKALDRALAIGELDPTQPVVTFCTGGIRCEKAAPYLQSHGFDDVYQVEGRHIALFR